MAFKIPTDLMILKSIGNGQVSDIDISDEGEDPEHDVFKRFNRKLETFSHSSKCYDETKGNTDISTTSTTLPEGTLNDDITWTKLPFRDVNVVLDDLDVPDPVTSLRNPVDYFMDYIHEDIFEMFAVNTNKYAVQNKAKKFKPTNKREIKMLIAFHMIMGCLKRDSLKMYWDDSTFGIPIILRSMTLNRFIELRNNLHIITDEDIPENNQDKFIKVRILYDRIKKKCNSLPKPRKLAFGDLIVPYKKGLKIEKYDIDKVGPWRVKLFVMVSDAGMIYDFILFQTNCTELNQNNIQQYGFGHSIALHFVQNLKKNAHFLGFDDRFATSQLFKHLHSLGFYINATVKPKCFGNPPLLSNKQMSKLGRGSTFEISSEVQNNDCIIGLVKWWNNKSIILASNFTTTGSLEQLPRYDRLKRDYAGLEVPNILTSHSMCMVGLEKLNEKISSYRTVIKSKKWTLQLIMNAFNFAVSNAWLQYKKEAEELSIPKNKRLTCENFRLKLFTEITEDTDSLIYPPARNRYDLSHVPNWDESKKETLCKNPACSGNKKTLFYCDICDVHLCLSVERNCFREFHTKELLSDSDKEN